MNANTYIPLDPLKDYFKVSSGSIQVTSAAPLGT
jgi:hypothetical protein